eukprot:CAMPEP_0202969860 /NCGR_PEP_ID=MMETSP1396-20130829/15758_1 /ASSEMBLY_ACC=CAM_ASM_000872 /TAXON_ID= /ORGANISM="Pseudokeronopsis sp., Strain Brazil" /LENGTH=250 /DNA_ID=CAMNT_0049697893 /DNA_START=75 /DNA_END=827 /DNA_ORIENTATION=+
MPLTYPPSPQQQPKSSSGSLVYIHDSIISFSLKTLTIFGCSLVTSTLLAFLYIGCSNEMVECTYPELPWISDLTALHFFDRVFCIVTVFFMLAVFQADIRAFHHALQGIAAPWQQDVMLLCGTLCCFALPLVAYFDTNNYGNVHSIMAVTFFATMGIYAVMLAWVASSNRDKFSQEAQPAIDRMVYLCYLMAICLAFSTAEQSWITHLVEWVTTFLYLNYFAFVIQFLDYFDSVLQVDSPTLARAQALKA